MNISYDFIIKAARDTDLISRGENPDYPYNPDPNKFQQYGKNPYTQVVIDENKSVKWNREEVERRNKAYSEERDRLRQARQRKYNEFESLAVDYIAQELSLSKEKAAAIWQYVYANYHSAGYSECVSGMDELLDLFKDVLK